MKRNQFIRRVVGMAVIGIPVITLLESCYKEEEDPTPVTNPTGDKDCLANGTNASISSNHGHSLIVSVDDVQAGIEKSYAIQGSSSHPHTVTISSSQFNTLKSNNSVEIVSSNDSGHTHSVTVSCA